MRRRRGGGAISCQPMTPSPLSREGTVNGWMRFRCILWQATDASMSRGGWHSKRGMARFPVPVLNPYPICTLSLNPRSFWKGCCISVSGRSTARGARAHARRQTSQDRRRPNIRLPISSSPHPTYPLTTPEKPKTTAALEDENEITIFGRRERREGGKWCSHLGKRLVVV